MSLYGQYSGKYINLFILLLHKKQAEYYLLFCPFVLHVLAHAVITVGTNIYGLLVAHNMSQTNQTVVCDTIVPLIIIFLCKSSAYKLKKLL